MKLAKFDRMTKGMYRHDQKKVSLSLILLSGISVKSSVLFKRVIYSAIISEENSSVEEMLSRSANNDEMMMCWTWKWP